MRNKFNFLYINGKFLKTNDKIELYDRYNSSIGCYVITRIRSNDFFARKETNKLAEKTPFEFTWLFNNK